MNAYHGSRVKRFCPAWAVIFVISFCVSLNRAGACDEVSISRARFA